MAYTDPIRKDKARLLRVVTMGSASERRYSEKMPGLRFADTAPANSSVPDP